MRFTLRNLSAFCLIAFAMLAKTVTASAQTWTPNGEERDIAERMADAPGQRRPFLTYDPILSRVARERAMDMAQRRYFDHINPDGHGANYLVRQAGYILPSSYPSDGNNLESIAAGYPTAMAAWSGWMDSPDHKRHLLGEIDFFAGQTSYGIGYYEDSSSPYRTYWVVITAPPQPNPPTVTIVSPTEGASVPEGALTVSGTTGGNQAAASVQVAIKNANGRSSWQPATGTISWSSTFETLAPGSNTLHVRTLSVDGAVLAQAARRFDYVVLRPLTVHVEGEGSVGKFLGTTQRRVGHTYTITATPAEGWLFAGWSGSWNGTQARFTFNMEADFDLTANFVPNPFLTMRGSYAGLVGDEQSVHDARGFLRLRLNGLGRFTGRLFFAGRNYTVLGRFNLAGNAVVRIPRPDNSALKLRLTLDALEGIVGTLQDGDALVDLRATPAMQTDDALAAFAGEYSFTLSVDPSNVPSQVQPADGTGLAVVQEIGRVTFSGVLPDGRAFRRNLWLAADGHLAFYAPLYGGAGSLTGVLVFEHDAEVGVNGTLSWSKRESFDALLDVH
ncbi:MAG TPA: CAP domain-containing protein [Chthoniobacteraceae bacterium]|nr:CAP domain-containing protein [Chthoniobacteraceae bacterium]